jgi:hypothetical protein
MTILNDLLNSRATTQPVNCLGLTFENDDARRAHFFLELCRHKFQ